MEFQTLAKEVAALGWIEFALAPPRRKRLTNIVRVTRLKLIVSDPLAGVDLSSLAP